MDFGLYCDSCHGNFDTVEKIPMIILCGHTVCKDCAIDVQRNSQCKICQKPQLIEAISTLKVNQKLFAVLTIQQQQRQQQAQPLRSNNNSREASSQQQSNRPLYSFQSAHITNMPTPQLQQQLVNSQNLQNLQSSQNNENVIQQFKPPQSQVNNQSAVTTNSTIIIKQGGISDIIKSSSGTQSEIQNVSILNDEQLLQTPLQNKNDLINTANSNISSIHQSPQTQQHQQQQQEILNGNLQSQNNNQEKVSPSPFIQNTSIKLPNLDSQIEVSLDFQHLQKQPLNSNHIPNPNTQSQQLTQRQLCKIHFDRVIEYFCQQCNTSVCSKCMFLHHNGHDLKQIEDALKILKTKLSQFDTLVNETLKDNQDAQQILINNKNQVQEMRDKQQEIIENKFKDLIQKIQDRKQQLSREILHKYETSLFKINDKLKMIDEQHQDLMKAQQFFSNTYSQLQDERFIKEEGTDKQVMLLEKVPEYDKFVYENTLKIKTIQVAQSKIIILLIINYLENAKVEYQEGLQIGLKPIELTLNSALSLIQTFKFDNYNNEMSLQSQIGQLPSRDNNIPRQLKIKPINSTTDSSKSSSMKLTSNQQLENSFSYPRGSRSGTPSHQSTQNFQNIQIPPLNFNAQMQQDNQRSSILLNNQVSQQEYLFHNSQNQNIDPTQLQKQLQQLQNQLTHQFTQPQNIIQQQLNLQQQPQQPVSQQQYKFQQQPLTQQQLQQQFGTMNTKFAKLKLSRQPTNSSQEFTLQLENPTITLQPNQQEQLIQITQQTNELGHNNNNSNINNIKNQNVSPLKKPLVSEDQKETQEEILSQKIKLLDHAIYLIGDTRFILMFDYKNSLWQQIYFDRVESHYQGDLKFTSICQINVKKKEFIMTGGCHKITKEASPFCYKFSIPHMRVFKQVQNMKQSRYGHASVFINQLVLVMGGFNHRDDEAQAPSTLNMCEKYSVRENEWTQIAPMHQERAYFSAVRVKEEFIYVFGGLQNYETTNSIEYYNIMLDKWTLVSFTMPIKLAKYGLAKVEENQIVIAGGLLIDNSSSTRSSSDSATAGQGASYSQLNTVYKFDCNTLKWTKLAKLNFRRSMYSNMPVKENMQIFAIGGTVEGSNEVYDIRKKKWNACQSYTSIMGQNDLQTYAVCALSKFSDD